MVLSELVYTGGTFDLFHWGHVKFLERCANFGPVVVSLNTDEFIGEYKGQLPVMTFSERKSALLGCRFVDRVIENTDGQDSKTAIDEVGPSVLAIGSDWARRDYYEQMSFSQQWLDDREIALVYIPYTPGVSSTEIKKRMSSGE